MPRISSDTVAAKDAISKLTGINGDLIKNQNVNFQGSNITAMNDGKMLTNKMLDDVGGLANMIQKQAEKVEGLANLIEYRDRLDSQSWGF